MYWFSFFFLCSFRSWVWNDGAGGDDTQYDIIFYIWKLAKFKWIAITRWNRWWNCFIKRELFRHRPKRTDAMWIDTMSYKLKNLDHKTMVQSHKQYGLHHAAVQSAKCICIVSLTFTPICKSRTLSAPIENTRRAVCACLSALSVALISLSQFVCCSLRSWIRTGMLRSNENINEPNYDDRMS